MVPHGGTSVAGSFIQTLAMVDVATGWTECLPPGFESPPSALTNLPNALASYPIPDRRQIER
jgi:hypothetical protein